MVRTRQIRTATNVSGGHRVLTKKANKAACRHAPTSGRQGNTALRPARRAAPTSGRQGNTALRPARRFSLDAPLDFYLHLDFYLCTFQQFLNKSYNLPPNLNDYAMLRDLPGVHR